MKFNKIAIIGVGLIGGSIGLAVKKRKLADEVIGVFRRRSTLKRALRHKVIDKGVMNIKEGVKDADLIIVASPVSAIPDLACAAARHAKKSAIITDVGGTKQFIVEKMEKCLRSCCGAAFVGSHPMAGSERTGVEFAKADLVKDAPCIVTRTNRTNKQALKKIINFWKSLGAKVEVMSPFEHDRNIAFISHLPHLVAFSIAGAVPEKDLIYAAEGFRDTTRVASSDPNLWADIFLTNKKGVMESIRAFEKYYKSILDSISRDDHRGVVRLLKQAKMKRDKFIYGK